MLYVNDELVDPKNEDWKWIKKEFDKIRQMSNPIRVMISNYEHFEKLNPTGAKEIIPGSQIRLMGNLTREGMSETWTYSKNKPTIKDGTMKFHQRYIHVKDGQLFLDPILDTDLVYFLFEVKGILKSNEYVIEDLEKDAEQVITSLSAESALNFYLMSEMSPLFNKNDQLREIASSWGVPNADTVGLAQLKLRLRDAIVNSDTNIVVTKRGIKDFVEEVANLGTVTKYRALMQKALDKKIIGFNNRENAWYWLNVNTGDFAEWLVPVLPIQLDQRNLILWEYLQNNAQVFKTIQIALGEAVSTPKEKVNMPEKYSHLSWAELKSYASSRGVKDIIKKKQGKILEELEEMDKQESEKEQSEKEQ